MGILWMSVYLYHLSSHSHVWADSRPEQERFLIVSGSPSTLLVIALIFSQCWLWYLSHYLLLLVLVMDCSDLGFYIFLLHVLSWDEMSLWFSMHLPMGFVMLGVLLLYDLSLLDLICPPALMWIFIIGWWWALILNCWLVTLIKLISFWIILWAFILVLLWNQLFWHLLHNYTLRCTHIKCIYLYCASMNHQWYQIDDGSTLPMASMHSMSLT